MTTFAVVATVVLVLLLVNIYITNMSDDKRFLMGYVRSCASRLANAKPEDELSRYRDDLLCRASVFDYVRGLNSDHVIILNKGKDRLTEFKATHQGMVVFYVDDPYSSTCRSTSNDDISHIRSQKNVALFVSDNINSDGVDECVFHWPIGLESRMAKDIELKEYFLNNVRKSDANDRNSKVLCNAHLSTYPSPASGLRPDRLDMLNDLHTQSPNVVFWEHRKSRRDCFDEMVRYNTELCPEGNGIDTHRFYEAFALGEIPIVRRGMCERIHTQFANTQVVDEWVDVLELDLPRLQQSMPWPQRMENLRLSTWLYKALRGRCRIVTFFTRKLCDEWRNLAASLRKVGLLDLLLVYVLDEASDKCVREFSSEVEIRRHFISNQEGGDFGSGNFNKLMMRKLEIILEVVREGFFTFYLDSDIVVLGDIVQDYFTLPPRALHIQSDQNRFTDKKYTPDGKVMDTSLCAGCMFFTPSKTSIRILEAAIVAFPSCTTMDDQCAVNKVLASEHDYDALCQLRYINGSRYFDNPERESLHPSILLIHNNWIVGVEAKEKRFKDFNLWFLQEQT